MKKLIPLKQKKGRSFTFGDFIPAIIFLIIFFVIAFFFDNESVWDRRLKSGYSIITAMDDLGSEILFNIIYKPEIHPETHSGKEYESYESVIQRIELWIRADELSSSIESSFEKSLRKTITRFFNDQGCLWASISDHGACYRCPSLMIEITPTLNNISMTDSDDQEDDYRNYYELLR